jgi:Lon protease-like protein
MDDDYDLKDFPNVSRLFPLPGVVLFPHSMLPLHIFEPRYRQMTEDALASDRLITIVQVRSPLEWTSPTEPALEDFGCLGRIFKYERLPDGRFNFLLLGRKRVRLTKEVPSGKLYRTSQVEILEDIEPDGEDDSRRTSLIERFRGVYQGVLDPDLESLLESDIPLGALTDIVAQAMGLAPSVKQSFLAETHVARRATQLLNLLDQGRNVYGSSDDESVGFPPPFSRN